MAALALLAAGFSGVIVDRSPGGNLQGDERTVEDIAAIPEALRFGDPDPDPGVWRAGQGTPEERGIANFGPDLANQLLVMAAIVASSALIALRKRSGSVLGRSRQWRARSG